MIMKKRTFTKEEKLRIIKEASEHGVNPTLEKYGVYRAFCYSWEQKFEQMGEEGFDHGMTPRHLKRICEPEKENHALKQLLAEKESEGRLKSELLKKKNLLNIRIVLR
jgi:putative transposase